MTLRGARRHLRVQAAQSGAAVVELLTGRWGAFSEGLPCALPRRIEPLDGCTRALQYLSADVYDPQINRAHRELGELDAVLG